MPRPPSVSLGRIIEHMGRVSVPGHRDLVRGMVAELESIGDRGERRRFALGALAALARLGLRAYGRATLRVLGRLLGVHEPESGAGSSGPSRPKLTNRRLLRRHVTPFAVSIASLTLLLWANHAVRQVPRLSGQGAPASTIAEALLLALPFIMALTIPMSVFLAVSWVFTRLGAEGALMNVRQEGDGVRRLIVPVLGAATVVAALTLVSNTQVLPRSNARLVEVLVGPSPARSDRQMTVGELREAAREARTEGGTEASTRAVMYEVEIQKRFALAAACVILALFGAAIGLRFPRGGVALVFGAGGFAFVTYYLSLVAGESLADRQVVSPFVAMWMSNALLLAVVGLLLRRPAGHDPTGGSETFAVEGG